VKFVPSRRYSSPVTTGQREFGAEPSLPVTGNDGSAGWSGDVRHGVRLGLDPGDARIGVARSDPSGLLATPVETVQRGRSDLARIVELLADEQDGDPERVLEVVVGLPRSLSGGEGPAAVKVREWARRLARSVAPVPVRLADERLTTVSAEAMLRDRGRSGAKRRAVVDQAAAVVILQHVLDTERTSGIAPGEIIEESD
jgi:putative Holliday junction resolvase